MASSLSVLLEIHDEPVVRIKNFSRVIFFFSGGIDLPAIAKARGRLIDFHD